MARSWSIFLHKEPSSEIHKLTSRLYLASIFPNSRDLSNAAHNHGELAVLLHPFARGEECVACFQ
jgi:hypothetical protein